MFHLSSSFSPVSFSRIAFNGAQQIIPERQDGRSGYWRLFFTQMQEEALKEYEKKTEPKSDTGAVEPTPVEAKKAPAKKKPKRAEREVVDQPEPIELPKFRRKPIYQTPNTYDALANLPNIETLYQSVVSIRNTLIIDLEQQRIQRRKQTRRRVAAFLLLAA